MNYQELIDKMTMVILDNIQIAINKHANYDQTYKGCVQEVVNPKKYKVLINGELCTATSSISCKVGDFVWVCAPRSNKDNMFVVCKTQ